MMKKNTKRNTSHILMKIVRKYNLGSARFCKRDITRHILLLRSFGCSAYTVSCCSAKTKNDLQIATVPLWYPNFEPCRILDSLCWLDSVYTYVYEVVPKVIVTVKGKHPHKKIELVSSAGASPEHLELASKIENLIDVSVNLPHSTSFMVREGGRAFLVNHASNKYINPMHLV